MSKTIRSLTAEQTQRFSEAQSQLAAGRPQAALKTALQLAQRVPDAPDAQQLLGMCLAETGDRAGAENAFRRALGLAPGNEIIALNVASWLLREHRPADAWAVLSAAPVTARTAMERGLVALRMRNYVQARDAYRHALKFDPHAAAAWHGLGNALRETDDIEAAIDAYRRACTLSPTDGRVWVNLAAALRLQGSLEEALTSLERAGSLGFRGPELANTRVGILSDAGRADLAISAAQHLVQAVPGFAQGHETLAHLLWEHGPRLAPAVDPIAAFRAAVFAQPDHAQLRARYGWFLLSAGRHEVARDDTDRLRRLYPDDVVLGWQHAEALNQLRDFDAAAVEYARVGQALGSTADASFFNAYARFAFRAGQPELAQRCVSAALQAAPLDQEAWAHQGTLWRLRGDPREDWLCDYERYVGLVEVDVPGSYDGQERFLAELSSVLEPLHQSARAPVNQTLENGSQTTGRLFGRPIPLLSELRSCLTASIQRWIDALPDDPSHPFLSRKQGGIRIGGSWSVRLRQSGRHSNHIHPQGWMSSAYYVALPDSVSAANQSSGHAGCIQLGRPLDDLGLDLPPRRIVTPRVGHIALFPSYCWHGTLPFDDHVPRMTIAFDMQPSGS